MRLIGLIIIALVLFIGVTFACLNAEIVTINYYIGSAKLPLSLLLVIVLTLGALCGLMVGLKLFVVSKRETYRLRHRLKIADKEIANLRVIPVQDSR